MCFSWKLAVEEDQESKRGESSKCRTTVSGPIEKYCASDCNVPKTKYALTPITYPTADKCNAAAALLGSTCSGYTYSKDTDLGEFIMTCQPDDVMDSSGMGCHAPTPCWDSTCSDIFGYTRASCLKRSEGADYLDAAVRGYCNNVGLGSPECACMNFPRLASPWCDRATVTCRPDVLIPDATAEEARETCYAREFLQSSVDQGGHAGYSMVQFSGCNPLPCWYEPCLSSPNERLITTRMADIQASGCKGVCYTIDNNSQFQYPMNASPLPSSANITSSIGSQVTKRCCDGASACVPELPVVTAISPEVTLALNQTKRFPMAVNNQGDTDVVVQIESDQSWLSVNPGQLFVPARGSAMVMLEWDDQVVSVLGRTWVTNLKIKYNDSQQDQTTTIETRLTIGDPVAPTVSVVSGVPPNFAWSSGILLAGAAAIFLLSGRLVD